MTPETIRIFLPTGDAAGIREASIETRPIEIILIPKTEIQYKKELDFLGCYILVDTLQAEKPEIYVGKGRVKNRVEMHLLEKPFWNLVFAIKSTDKEGFNEAHIAYLENILYQKAKENGRCFLQSNKQKPGDRPLDKYTLASMEKHLNTIEILVACLGLKIFQPLSEKRKADILTLHNKLGLMAKGEVVEDGFLVYKGATLRLKTVPSYASSSEERCRNRLIENGLLKQEGDVFVLKEDYKFSSPSNAAGVILGCFANGLIYWRNAKKQTLSDIYKAVKNV